MEEVIFANIPSDSKQFTYYYLSMISIFKDAQNIKISIFGVCGNPGAVLLFYYRRYQSE